MLEDWVIWFVEILVGMDGDEGDILRDEDSL